MRYRLRTLVLVVFFTALIGCRDRKVEQIQRGAEGVDQHAQEIEQAANSQP